MNTPPPGEPPQQRLRLRFSKGGPARFTGHLDLARTLERSLNRAQIPLAYSQGFTRRPRLSLAAALPLGYTSDAELADIWLLEMCSPDEVLTRFNSRVAPGVEASQVEEVAMQAPSLQQSIAESYYSVRFDDETSAAGLSEHVDALMARDEVLIERKRGKKKKLQQYDLRPLILDLEPTTTEINETLLKMHLVQTPTRTGRPDDILKALGYDPLDLWVHRTKIVLAGIEKS